MEKKVRCIEVRTPDGKPILNLHMYERENGSSNQQKGRDSQAGNNSNVDSPMTDAQKRYLFRILAERGIEEDKAHQRLKDLFGVDSLQEVSKIEASRMIERLLEEAERK